MSFRAIFLLTICSLGVRPLISADVPPESETMAEHRLKDVVEHQKVLFSDAVAQGKNMEDSTFKTGVEHLVHEYESLLHDNSDFAPGFASYGYMLWKVGMRNQAVENLTKANQLDPSIPLVKNELGNYYAEEGKPLEAETYFKAAISLEPKQPLYYYQLGTLFYEARSEFLHSGEWTRAALDHATQDAFRQASELAPDRIEFSYRYAESFYDMSEPDWPVALKTWQALEARAQSDLERQTMRLHETNVLLNMGNVEDARRVLGTVTDPELDIQKQKLIARIAAEPGK
jgi:tetratricopeptide (TPR) repeat protein